MNKSLLLAGVACLFATSANAMDWNMKNYKPYVGAEYVYSYAKLGSDARNLKNDFNSGKVDLGMQFYRYWDLEFSFQQSGENKSNTEEYGRVKNYFQAYALDMYGKYPLMCSPLSAVGTVGTAIYHMKYKDLPQNSNDRVGYRVGVGMQYDITQNFAARVIGRYSYVGTEYLNNLMEVNAGFLYSF